MDAWLSIGQAIEKAGGWAAFLGLVSIVGVGLWRRWWVPGFLYVEKEAEVKELQRAVARLTESLTRERRRRRSDA
jgi:hypothetical protein